MFLDEKLVQMELKRQAKADDGEELERAKEEIRHQAATQKTVYQFIDELRAGAVVIDEVEYRCEKQEQLYLFPDDIENIVKQENSILVAYKTLEMGINRMYLAGALVVKNEKEYQKQMQAHFRQSGVPYYPIDTGKLKSGNTNIFYAVGLTTSPIGGIFVLHYYYKTKTGFASGNYTCRLLKRYSFEHLFLAMLHLMCEEEN